VALRLALAYRGAISPGTPTTTELGGTGLTTTALAPMRLLSQYDIPRI